MIETFKATQELKELLSAKGIAFKETSHLARANEFARRIYEDYEVLNLIGKDSKVYGYIEAVRQYGIEVFNVWEIDTLIARRRTFLQRAVEATADYTEKVASLH